MSEVEIRPFEPEFLDALLALQQRLWSPSTELNRRYLQWKFTDNPNSQHGAIFIAVADGRLAAARAFMGTVWRDPDGNPVPVPLAGDTVVAPEFEGRRSLINRLTKVARDAFAERGTPFMLNTSASPAPYLHSVRAGWEPVAAYTFLRRRTVATKLQRWLGKIRRLGAASNALATDRFAARVGASWSGGGLTATLTDRPDATDLAAIAASHDRRDRYTMLRDEPFFRWRFTNPLLTYYVLTSRRQGAPAAYIVIRVHVREAGMDIRAIDWAYADWPAFAFLLEVLAREFPGVDMRLLAGSFVAPELAKLAALGYAPVGAAPTVPLPKSQYRSGVIAVRCAPKGSDVDHFDRLVDNGFAAMDFRGIESDGA